MHAGRLGSIAGFALQVCGAGAVVIWPNEKLIGWGLLGFGTAFLIGSFFWWFFANFKVRYPWVSRQHVDGALNIDSVASVERAGVCEFSKYQWSLEHIDRGENHGGKQQYFRLRMPVKFIRDAKAVTIRVSAMREITWYLDKRSPLYSWKAVESRDYYSGDVEEVIFATVAVNRQHHGCYGDMREDAFLVNVTSRHVFTFDVFFEGGRDSTKLYLESPSKGVVANPQEGLGKLAGLIILQEGDDVFAEDWVTKGTPAPSATHPPEGGAW